MHPMHVRYQAALRPELEAYHTEFDSVLQCLFRREAGDSIRNKKPDSNNYEQPYKRMAQVALPGLAKAGTLHLNQTSLQIQHLAL